ncbi:hypothetical protein AVEN_257626-1 [Araneus ventricosus]|uniref:THAP-type domain-containing protein n=1 Tax=Araneus ventricosus TaxID=182803 RepID=A0A4Y2E478_ARAVE|nr:hypothetical protein AVEN_257626-1 [Araneus ventricosus]
MTRTTPAPSPHHLINPVLHMLVGRLSPRWSSPGLTPFLACSNMPYRCCAVNCKGNYKNGPKVPVFSFPKNENLRRRWLQALNRKDFVITANSRVCIQHFSEDLVIKESSFVDWKHNQNPFVAF